MTGLVRSGRGCLAVALIAFTLVAAGCGTKSANSTGGGGTNASSSASVGHLPTAKFVLHVGLAFGAFHRYIYTPFKAGSLTGGGFFSHKTAKIKAGLAGLFAYHELKLALADAKASPILSKLLTPVDALAAKLSALGSSLKSGHVDGSSIAAASSGVAGVTGLAHQAGASISDKIPSVGQLAGG